MTSTNLPTWQRHLNPKLVKRFNSLLTKPGVVNIRMGRNIIERSPDILHRLPLLAQQMQRWSTTINLKSEPTPIIYIQNQYHKNKAAEAINSSLSSSDIIQINQQLPVVKAKAMTVRETAGENQRSQSTPLVLQPDNSLPNLDTNISTQSQSLRTDFFLNQTQKLISSNPIKENSDVSEIPIQSKLDTTSSPSTSLPVVQPENSLPNQSLQDTPLVNLVNPNSFLGGTTPTSQIPIQSKLDTTSSHSISLPVVQPENSLPNQSLQDIPLVNLVNPNSSPQIPIQSKLDTTSSPSISLPVVQPENSLPNQSLQDIPLVNEIPQPRLTEPLLDLVKKNNHIYPIVESLSSVINFEKNSSNLTRLIKPKLENRNTVVVYARTKKPEIVKVNSEPYLPQLEPLIWSNYPIAKQKGNNLNAEQLNHQTGLMSTADRSTSSHQLPNPISNSIPVNQTINISHSSVNSHPPPINQSQKTSLEGVSIPPHINVDDLIEKVERRIMRRLVIESERRGKRKWR
ncbi:hypothetical protein [Umezakia ovalisporum]|uniref:hypothetical protein n=1 Tax=Umezakia ovalisporum TaxID=75695 RepID=UPI002473C228|nr:hypothetical protein [Umezakia ovalisporum]MDH6086958.1 hypothetical protein [Umezakia ovalisporum Ak1311]